MDGLPADISPEQSTVAPVLAGERVAFTGTLASMTHAQAADLVEQNGGTAAHHVTHLSTLLVIGDEGWPLDPDGHPSQKLEEARRLQEEGVPLRLLSEAEFLAALGLDRPSESTTFYTPAMLCQMLSISTTAIRRWERLGWIQPVRRVMRMPYFDYSEVAKVKRLSQLLASGLSPEQLARSLERVNRLWPEAKVPVGNLDYLAWRSQLAVRDERGLLEPGSQQRLFDFSIEEEHGDDDSPLILKMPDSAANDRPVSASESPQEWIARSADLAEDARLPEAIEAARCAIMDAPHEATYHLQLADLLYRSDNIAGAIERYHVAIELDHNYVEAWTLLGCVLSQANRSDEAINAFQIALGIYPDLPDAHFHLAELLHQLDRELEAIPHWKAYLQFDQRGPWAVLTRQRLAQAEK